MRAHRPKPAKARPPMTELDLFSDVPAQSEMVVFEPTRVAGLERLEKFAARTGTHYATQRNYDASQLCFRTIAVDQASFDHRRRGAETNTGAP